MASPRSKATKVHYTSSEYQLILQFVKSNIKQILNLISSDALATMDNLVLGASDINALKVLFTVSKIDGTTVKQNLPLSSFAPFFVAASSSSSAKVKLGVVSDWVTSILGVKDKQEDVVEVVGICKGVSTQDQDLQTKNLKIIGCEDSYIYINTSVNCVLISSCVNCTIMVCFYL